MRTTFSRVLLAGTALSCLGLAAPAFAQSESAASDPNLVIVTARRLDERLQDVPISITVFNQEQLAARNIVNSQDLATYTPSLSTNTNFGGDNTSFAIRGFVQDIGTAPAVGVYFADVVAPRGASNGLPTGDGAGPGAFFDLQNVQILKGPQGTLQGRNTTGGAVLLVPQKPTHDAEGYLEGSVGNYNLKRIQGVVNIPFNDNIRARIGVDNQRRDGYEKNTSGVGPTNFGNVNYTALRASVVVDLTPDLENYTIASYTKSNTRNSFGKLIAASPSGLGSFAQAQLADQAAKGEGFWDARQDLTNPESRLKQWQVINTTTWNATKDITVKNIVSYAELTDDYESAIFGTAFSTPAIAALNLPSYRFGFASSIPAPNAHTADESTFTEELQFQGHALDDRLTWQAGGYLEISKPLSTVGSQSPVILSCTNSGQKQCYDVLSFLGALGGLASGGPATAPPAGALNLTLGRTSFHDIAAYGQATYKINDQLKLTGGLRYTSDKEVNDSLQTSSTFGYPISLTTFQPLPAAVTSVTCTNPLSVATGCASHYEMKSHKPTWLIDLDYNPMQDVLLYAKYARGYRAGTIAPNVTAPYNIVKPETVDAYEVGFKTSFDKFVRGSFNAAGFYNDFRNQQLQLGFDAAPGATVSPTAAPINAGKSQIYGVELEGNATLFEGFNVHAAYTYLHTEIKTIPTFVAPAGSLYVIDGAQQVGDPLALSPKHKLVLSADYTLPLDEKIGRITVGANYVYTSSQVTNYGDRNSPFPEIAGLDSIPSFHLVNLDATWSNVFGHPVDLGVVATNITNEKYYTFISGIGVSTGFETAQLGTPRMYGVRLRYRFGS
jgi:iron complex outermembrane receptor protein